jgi:hypothetical protein
MRRLFFFFSILGVIWGSLEIKRTVESDSRFRMSRWSLNIPAYPDWVTPEIQTEIEAIGNIGSRQLETAGKSPGMPLPDRTLTIFKHKVLAELRQELLANSWIRSVPRLAFNYPGWPSGPESASENAAGNWPEKWTGGLDADLEIRRPVAAVRWGEKYYFIDGEGHRAGQPVGSYDFDKLRIPAIAGIEQALGGRGAPAASGELWQNREILEGLAVAWEIFKAGFNWRFPQEPIYCINIQNVGGKIYPLECEVVLKTPNLLLGWGRSPISKGARILPVTQVLENLGKVLGQAEKFAGAGLIRLDTTPLVRVTDFKGAY